MVIKTDYLRVFCTVAETGNLTDAAHKLSRTPSALSMTLKQFEAGLGAKLFEGERKNHLTPLGQHVLSIAQTQLRNHDDALRNIQALASAPRGLLQIAAIPSVAHRIYGEAVIEMHKAYPEMHFELRDADSSNIVEMLGNGQIDLGIVSGEHSINSTHSQKLFSDQFGVVCAKAVPNTENLNVLEDLAKFPLIANNLTAAIASNVFQRIEQNAKLRVRNTLSLLSLLTSGEWVSILPKSVVQILPGALQFIALADLHAERSVHIHIRKKTVFPSELAALSSRIIAMNWD